MTTAEILLLDLDIEINNTRRTLQRLPEDKSAWVPHPKSMLLGRLAMHCATLPLFGLYILTDDRMDLAAPKRSFASLVFTNVPDMLAQLDTNAAQLRSALAAATDDQLAQPWPFTWGAQVISNASRTLTYRNMFFNHLTHHTAQLGVYLRLLDLPVPALYGPSADEPLPS